MPGTAVQHTLKTPIHCTGVGLHSGKTAAVTLRPAAADTGIVFRRLDLGADRRDIPALWSSTVEAPLCTVLTAGDEHQVMTIEHLMAALSGCGIDNAVVDMIGPEVPIMDGSAGPFVFLIECAGRVEQRAQRQAIRVLRPVEVRSGDAYARLLPSDDFIVSCAIEFDNPLIGRQELELAVGPEIFKLDVSRARTFGFRHEVEALRDSGRGLGGSLDNAVVVDGDHVMNEGGLRYGDEFVRHKILDIVGDLYLAGAPLLARFEGERPSHALTRRLLIQLFADEANWTRSPLPAALLDCLLEEPIRAAV